MGTEILEQYNKALSENTMALTGHKTSLDSFMARFNEKLAEVTPEAVAKLEEPRFLAGVSSFRPFGVPVAEAAIGGAVAVITAEVIDLVSEKISPTGGTWVKVAGKGIAAWACAGPLTKWIGKPIGYAAAILLAYDAIRTIVPYDDWIRARIPGHSLGEFGSRAMTSGPSVIRQAEQVLVRVGAKPGIYDAAFGA